VWVEREEPQSRLACKFFAAGLVLNVVWMFVFFGLKNPGAAAIECVVLWLTVFATFSLFWQRFRLAGALMLPYLICLTFIAYLNIVIWQMNA
ncbi:MAG: TspO/MBR family protein, partial [Pirellulaceae bacterium]